MKPSEADKEDRPTQANSPRLHFRESFDAFTIVSDAIMYYSRTQGRRADERARFPPCLPPLQLPDHLDQLLLVPFLRSLDPHPSVHPHRDLEREPRAEFRQDRVLRGEQAVQRRRNEQSVACSGDGSAVETKKDATHARHRPSSTPRIRNPPCSWPNPDAFCVEGSTHEISGSEKGGVERRWA